MTPLKTRAGFSLTELLVSLVVLSLISLAATSALSVGKRIWSRAQAAPDVSLADAEINALRRVFSQNVSGTSEEGGGFSGSRNRLTFHSLMNAEGDYSVVGEISLVLLPDMMEIRFQSGTSVRSTKLTRVRAEELSYYGRREGGEAEQWTADWNSRYPAPELVRIKLSPSGEQLSDELIIPLQH